MSPLRDAIMLLQRAPSRALRDIADHLEREARDRRRAAADATRARKYRKSMATATAVLAHHLAGHDDDTALEVAALELHCEPDRLRPLIPRARAKLEAWNRIDRDRKIMTMARAGLTNIQIAAAFDLHPVQIGRIVKKAFRETTKADPIGPASIVNP